MEPRRMLSCQRLLQPAMDSTLGRDQGGMISRSPKWISIFFFQWTHGRTLYKEGKEALATITLPLIPGSTQKVKWPTPSPVSPNEHSHTHCGEAEPGPGHQWTASADLREQQERQLDLISLPSETWNDIDRYALLFMWSDSKFHIVLGLKGSSETT